MNGKVLSGPAAVLVVVLFFLPWLVVSCDEVQVGELSGYQLATGEIPEESSTEIAADQISGEPLLFAVPAVGVITLVLLVITIWKASFETNASWGQIIASLVGILVLLLEWFRFQSESEAGFEAVVQPALWGTLAGLVAIGAGALFDLVTEQRRARAGARGSGRKRKRRRRTGPSGRQGDALFPADDSHTILDDDLVGPGAYGGATILDEALVGDADYASHTILDDDLVAGQVSAGHTILDDDLVGGAGYGSETILDEDLLGAREYGNVTILDDDLVQDESATEARSRREAGVTELSDDLARRMADDPTVIRQDLSPAAASSQAPEPEQHVPSVDKTEILQGEADTLAWLVVTSGERKGEQFRLFSNTTIGRDLSNDIVLEDTALSGKHARIKVEHGRFFVFDRESTNGVFVFDEESNRWEQRDAFEVKQGSKIKVGRTVLQLVTA